MTKEYKKNDVVDVLDIDYNNDKVYSVVKHTIVGTIDIIHRKDDGTEVVAGQTLEVKNELGDTYNITAKHLEQNEVVSRVKDELDYAKQDLQWAEQDVIEDAKRVEMYKRNVAVLEAIVV